MNYLKFGFTLLVVSLFSLQGFAQCNTTNFTVTSTNGTCFSNGTITVSVPTSTDCSAWVAVINRPSDGFSTELNIPNEGGSVTFNSLPPGSYNVSMSNGFETISHPNNPVAVTTSYVNMSISATSSPPTCWNSAPGYSPDGTLTINVANGTGIGPFVYTIVASNGTQTFTSSSRTMTFNTIPGGEAVNISVTDQASGTTGCSVTSNQTHTTATNTAATMAFSDRPFNYERDCSNTTSSCSNVNLFVNIRNLNAPKLITVQQPGNATITIESNTYDLTYVTGSARFRYDPIATGGPQLVNGTQITVRFYDGCNVITKTSTVTMNDNFLSVNPTTITNTTNCSITYRLQILGDQDLSGGTCCIDRAVYFCQQNTLTIERRISTSPDVWLDVSGSEVTPNPTATTNPLSVNIGVAIPSAGVNYFVSQPGVYRVTASDACHSVQRIVNVVSTNPFNNVSASQITSVLEGTSSIKVHFNGLPTLASPVKVKISRVDGQTSMTINPTQPATLAGSYTINFPIERNVPYPVSFYYFQDLPLGQYVVELSDGCSSSTGFTKTINVNLTNATSYNPIISVTPGCIGSNSISFNMNPVNTPNSNVTARLYRNNGGSLGTLVQTTSNGALNGVFNNLNSDNYFIQFENIKSEALFNGNNCFSVAMNNIGPWTYRLPVTIQPYQDISVTTVTSFCDIGDTNSGIILAQVTGGTIAYPITFELYSVSDPLTPLPGQSGTFNSIVDAVAFEDVSVGDYFVRVTTACYSVDINVTLSTSGSVPQAEVSNPVICPGSPTTVAIIAASQNLFDVTWYANGQVVGSGMPITLAPPETTTYTAVYTLKSIYGCSNSPEYTSNVTVTVTQDADLSLAVSDINLCDGTSPSITISNTQSEFTYEIVDESGVSFSPPLLANGNGGSLTIAIPNTITLTAGQFFKVKSTNGNAGCTGLLTDVSNVLNGVFDVSCPTFNSLTVECYSNLPNQTSFTEAEFEALGNADGEINITTCEIIEITANNSADTGICPQTITRTYTITEYEDTNNNGVRDSGEDTILNSTSCNQTITVEDTTAPSFVEALPTDVTVACDAVPTAATLTATDTCGTATVTYNEVRTDGSCPSSYSLARTWTATDACGLTTTHTQTITVEDTTAPSFVEALPADVIIECTDSIPTAVTLTAIDNCGTATVVYEEERINGSCSNYQLIRTWTALDICGNETSHIQIIDVQDTTSPVFVGDLPQDDFVNCDEIPIAPILSATDNCGNVTITFDEQQLNGDCTSRYQLIRTWTATDDCGNSSQHIQTLNLACYVKVYNAISPNGDGKNDSFLLEGIECYPNNSLEIYNRWGVKVFETKGYDNSSRLFSGYSDGRSTISRNELLPTGTYFYTLKYEYSYDGVSGKQIIDKTGYLYIQGK